MGLLKQISTAIRLNSANSARLVHEVNTPLTIIRNKISKIDGISPATLKDIVDNIDSLAEFVRKYLQWSETTYAPVTSTELYAIPFEKFVVDLVKDLNPIAGDRIKVVGHTSQNVFANKHELEHLLQNILTNALKYSPVDSFVEIKLEKDWIYISDRGPGIPKHVLERLGEPFNSGVKFKDGKTISSGLGLAWVKAITQKYSWKIDIQSSADGTKVAIKLENNSEA